MGGTSLNGLLSSPLVQTPEEFDAYLRKDIEKWAHVVKVSGAKIQ